MPQSLQEKMTSMHIPITLQHEPINCKYAISLMHKPLITQLSLLSNFPEDGPCEMKHVKNLPYINNKKPLVVIDGFFLYLCYCNHIGMNRLNTTEKVDLTQKRVHCQTLMDKAANSIQVRELPTHWVTTSFSRTLLHPVCYRHKDPVFVFTFI